MLGWLASAAEVWVVLRLLGTSISQTDALIVEGLAQPIRATSILVPGAVGTQEGGGVALCSWLGIPPATGLALWLGRRGPGGLFDRGGGGFPAPPHPPRRVPPPPPCRRSRRGA